MDNQQVYNEAMAKLAEARSCQSDIVLDLKALQEINNSIEKSNDGWWNWSNYIAQCITGQFRRNYLNRQITTRTKERNENLNDALSDALDIVDDEMNKNTFNPNSLGFQALGNIYNFMVLYNIRLQYSPEVQVKLSKITAKEMAKFPFDIRRFGW